MMWKSVVVITLTSCSVKIKCDLADCHNDPAYHPDEGPIHDMQFTWLGILQYIHIKGGYPHYFRVPRVLLVSPSYTLCTAADAGNIPDGYALGNVAFGEYERDERECGLTVKAMLEGVVCDPSILVLPIADVIIHHEYKNFGVKDSVALLKLIQPLVSKYMLPICLPFRNLMVDKNGSYVNDDFFHFDYSYDAPRDLGSEDREAILVNVIPKHLCLARMNMSSTSNLMCTTGCGFKSGSPIITHEVTGHWTLVGIATGHICPDPLDFYQGRPPPPHHIDIYPYVSWITTVITGSAMDDFTKNDPFGYVVPRSGGDMNRKGVESKWIGHWWVAGLKCFFRDDARQDCFRFYHETFKIKPHKKMTMTYFLEIDAPKDTDIICVKVGMPHSFVEPTVYELGSSEVKIRVPIITIKETFKFYIEAWGQEGRVDED